MNLKISSIDFDRPFELFYSDPVSYFPSEIVLNIFSFLTHHELLTCTCVSKSWRQLAEDDSFWKRKAVILNVASPYKRKISQEIANLYVRIQGLESYLNKPVKTPTELTHFTFTYHCSFFTIEDKKRLQQETNQHIEEAIECKDRLQEGFNTHLVLYRLHKSSWNTLKEFANALHRKFENLEGLKTLAKECLQQKDCETFWNLYEEIEQESDKNELLDVAVATLMQIQELDAFMAFFHHLILEKDLVLTRLIVGQLFAAAQRLNRTDLQEYFLQNIDSKIQLISLISVIHYLIKTDQLEKAKEIFSQYVPLISSEESFDICSSWIKISVKLGYFESALDLALSLKNEKILLNLKDQLEEIALDRSSPIFKRLLSQHKQL